MESRIGLKVIDETMMYKVLSTPSFIGQEYRMVEFLMEYAKEMNYKFGIDAKSNVYLCKGTPPIDGYYPCVTAHLDTVQDNQQSFIEKGQPLPLVTEEMGNRHLIYVEDFGLGGDDKCGIVIALAILQHTPVCKAVFFVEEESGCNGSNAAELPWFKDVGYIMGFDSPEGNCASWSCYGTCLFDRHFYETYLAELGEKFGLTNYVIHPYTDVMLLRIETALTCMNFGAGYYNYHTPNEFCIAEEMDHAAAMGLYLINRLGYKEYVYDSKDDDYQYFRKFFSTNNQ